MNISRVLVFPLLAAFAVLALSQCMAPKYREVRRQAPGGGWYVERIPVKPGEKVEWVKRPKPPKPPKEEKPAPVAVRQAPAAASAEPATPAAAKTKPVHRSWWKFWQRAPKIEEPAPVDDGSFWTGDGVSGKPKIKISLGEQKISYFKGGVLVGQSPMSSGREGYQTVVGTFFISEKDEDHKSSLYGNYVDKDGAVLKQDVDVRKDPRPPGAKFDGADMRWFMRIHKAIGMHEGYLPGFPASHGCIRLPSKMAEIFYKATPHGTLVEIVP